MDLVNEYQEIDQDDEPVKFQKILHNSPINADKSIWSHDMPYTGPTTKQLGNDIWRLESQIHELRVQLRQKLSQIAALKYGNHK